MNVILLISGVTFVVSVTCLLLQRKPSFWESVHMDPARIRGLHLLNIILWSVVVHALMTPALEYAGLLFTDLHLTYTVVALPPTIGWGIVYTRLIREPKGYDDRKLDTIAYLIAKKASKSETPETELVMLIQAAVQRGSLTEQAALKVLASIGQRDDELGDYARKLIDSRHMSWLDSQ